MKAINQAVHVKKRNQIKFMQWFDVSEILLHYCLLILLNFITHKNKILSFSIVFFNYLARHLYKLMSMTI